MAKQKPRAHTYPTNPALEAAVVDRADEDTPRLAYADWLDEHGDPDRAAFIRTEVALWDKHPADPDYVSRLVDREIVDALGVPKRLSFSVPAPFQSHGDDWIHDDHGFRFRRGFPFFAGLDSRSAPLSAAREREVLTRLFATSTVRGLDFHFAEEHHLRMLNHETPQSAQALVLSDSEHGDPKVPLLPTILAAPGARNVTWLDVPYVQPREIEALVSKSNPLRLKRFEAALWPASLAQANQLFSCECLGGMRHIRVRMRESEFPGTLRAIAGLRELNTFECFGFGPEEVLAFADAGTWRSLGRLYLLGFREMMASRGLAHAKLPKLAALELGRRATTNADLVELAASPVFDRLRSLTLHDKFGDKGIAAIASSACAPRLESLKLFECELGERGLRRIATQFPALLALELRRDRAPTSAAVTRFVTELACPDLRSLRLAFSFDDAAAIALSQNPSLTNLESLSVGWHDPKLTARGLAALLASPHLSRLKILSATGKNLDSAAKQLTDPAVLPALRRFGCPISQQTAATLAKARPASSANPVTTS